MKTQIAKSTKIVKVLVGNKKRDMLINRRPYDKKFGDTAFELKTASGEPIGVIFQSKDGTLGCQRVKARATDGEFDLNDRVVHRKSFESALAVATRWYSKFH